MSDETKYEFRQPVEVFVGGVWCKGVVLSVADESIYVNADTPERQHSRFFHCDTVRPDPDYVLARRAASPVAAPAPPEADSLPTCVASRPLIDHWAGFLASLDRVLEVAEAGLEATTPETAGPLCGVQIARRLIEAEIEAAHDAA